MSHRIVDLLEVIYIQNTHHARLVMSVTVKVFLDLVLGRDLVKEFCQKVCLSLVLQLHALLRERYPVDDVDEDYKRYENTDGHYDLHDHLPRILVLFVDASCYLFVLYRSCQQR